MYCLEEKLERQTQSGLMGSTAGAAGEALLRDDSQTLWTMYCCYREVKGQPTFMSHSRNQASDAWPLLRARIQEKEKPRKSFLSGTWSFGSLSTQQARCQKVVPLVAPMGFRKKV